MQLTIRSVDPELQHILKTEAKRRGLSVNRYVLMLLREAAGLGSGNPEPEREFHDLDHFIGTWTQQEYEEFEKELAVQRSIDEELWQ